MAVKKQRNDVYVYDDKNSNGKKILLRQLNNVFNVGIFANEKQFKKIKKKMGFDLQLEGEMIGGRILKTDYSIFDDDSFWNKKDIPRGAHKFKALSNGSIVNCYFVKDKKNKEIRIFRPNPNAKKVYRPLSIKKHIKYQQKNGIY